MAEIDNDVTADVIDVLPEEEFRVCLFSLGEDLYAVPVEMLTEIIISQKIFPSRPHRPTSSGSLTCEATSFRLSIYAPRFPCRGSQLQAIAIIKQGAVIIGIVVDNVSEVVGVPLTKVLAIPADAGGQTDKGRSRFLKSIIQREGGVAALLDVNRILEEIKLE